MVMNVDSIISSVLDEFYGTETLVEGWDHGQPVIGPFILFSDTGFLNENNLAAMTTQWKRDIKDHEEGGSIKPATLKLAKVGKSGRGFGTHFYERKPPKEGWAPGQTAPKSKGYLIGVDSNAKTRKDKTKKYMTGIMYLTPGGMDGMQNTCGASTPGCRGCCLKHAGQLRMLSHALAARTKLYYEDRGKFMDTVHDAITKAKTHAAKHGKKLAIRLNGTSDLPFHNYRFEDGTTILDRHGDVQFYDYTKFKNRMRDYMDGKLPENYHLTFSRSEENHDFSLEVLKRGHNVAVPFNVQPGTIKREGGKLPSTFHGHDVIDGDVSDLRFEDHEHPTVQQSKQKTGRGVWVGLRVKGPEAKEDETGFIVKDFEQHP